MTTPSPECASRSSAVPGCPTRGNGERPSVPAQPFGAPGRDAGVMKRGTWGRGRRIVRHGCTEANEQMYVGDEAVATTGPSTDGFSSGSATTSPNSTAVMSIRTGSTCIATSTSTGMTPTARRFRSGDNAIRLCWSLRDEPARHCRIFRDGGQFNQRWLTIGAQAAASLFDRFPGRWTVRQLRTNPAATAFWRTAIRYPFEEHERGTEIVQSFTTGL